MIDTPQFELYETITLVAKNNTAKTKLARDGDQWSVVGQSEFRRQPSLLLACVKNDNHRWVEIENDNEFEIKRNKGIDTEL